MKRRLYKFIGLLIFTVIGQSSLAQDRDTTIITVQGHIIDASTQEPVNATIKYESLPYGSKIGLFSGNAFTFHMENGNDYALAIAAEGYIPYTETLTVNRNSKGAIVKTIALKPTGINQLIRLEKLIFALGKADISEASHRELDELVNMLQAKESITIQLEGHTDFRGNSKQNMKLSEKRVKAVKDYLVNKGIDKRRIKTKAFGGSKPLSRSSDAEARRSNRRVEARILSN